MSRENNFRVHLAIALLVVGAMIWLKVNRLEAAILLLLISTILTLELVNTVVERFVDLLEPRVHTYVGLIKDLMAAAVLITSLAAAVIGLLILWPYLFPALGH